MKNRAAIQLLTVVNSWAAVALTSAALRHRAWARRGLSAHAPARCPGTTGLKCNRLGIGTGNPAERLEGAGQGRLHRLIHYAYDQGITWACAQSCTFSGSGAIKGCRGKAFHPVKIGASRSRLSGH
jgi:hypothetical protein